MSDRESRNDFIETLREVRELVRISPDKPDREELLGYFKDMELTAEQKNMVFEYLLKSPEESGQEPGEGNTFDNKPEEESQSISKALKLYLEELEGLPEYTEEERDELYYQLLEGKNEVIEKLFKAMLRRVALMADGYASDRAGLEDLIQEGNMALFIRLSELCGMGADCGYDLEEEMAEAAEGAMRAYASAESGEADRENALLGKAGLVNEAVKFLKERDGREPSLPELAKYTGLSEAELEDIASLWKK